MPTKNRKKRQQIKEWYKLNTEVQNQKCRDYHDHHKQAIRDEKSKKWHSEKAIRDRHRAAVKQTLDSSVTYRNRNKAAALVNTKKRLQSSEEYKTKNRLKARQRAQNRAKNTLLYKQYQQRMRKFMNKKRQMSAVYRKQSTEYDKKRRQSCSSYRQKHAECVNRRLAADATYRKKNRKRTQQRRQQLRHEGTYKVTERMRKRGQRKARAGDNLLQHVKVHCPASGRKTVLTKQQRYWIRRRKLLAAGRQHCNLLRQKRKMAQESHRHLLDVQLLFSRAQSSLRKAGVKVKMLHRSLALKAETTLQHIPEDRTATVDDITTAFNSVRMHTASSESYFREHSYQLLPSSYVVPIDTAGRAHVFKPVENQKNTVTENADEPVQATDDDNDNDNGHDNDPPDVTCWECNPDVCFMDQRLIDELCDLLRQIATVKPHCAARLYRNLDNCTNPARTNQLGHHVNCELPETCNSLLRPARLLACHFPALRTIVARIYEIRQLVLAAQNVEATMNSGNYDKLQHVIDCFHKILLKGGPVDKGDNIDVAVKQDLANQEQVINKYGQALRQVTQQRDVYTTDACDVCEQLRSDLSSLSSYANRKGYDSDKMELVLDLLYKHKTSHEDVYEFTKSILICRYCADHLRNNKDVARSAFNNLAVDTTPDCIKVLNLFELTLIKFCMTCITVIRLGQISNTKRPQNELTAALKGRIAYLPIDIDANARFLPENILNVDGLSVLVGGQPTKQQRIWTSVVDLQKVHSALTWLRDNNPLYKDVPVYSVDDMQQLITDRLKAGGEQPSADKSLLRKLDDAARSFLYENFTIQPISSDFPADMMVDYQLDKVHGNSTDIFDTQLDLMAFPELFPRGEKGMRDATRLVKIGTSDFIKSRLLNRDPKFRLNISYLFHCFQVQEVSNMCHSIGHMLRSVTGRALSSAAFFERLQNKDGEVQSRMFSLMANLRGSREYFARLGMDVKWMIRSLGPPTLFVTCSTAEWFSDSFLDYLRTVNSSVPGIQNMTAGELCAMDPVSVSIHFNKKWDAIFNKLIRAKNTPLFGEVEDHFWRLEYQARGAPHVHLMLWIKDAPVIGRNSPEEVKDYIESIITCGKPDSNQSPTLSQLVSQFQTHRCNKYCTKSYKINGKFYKKCKFGFPRPIKSEVELNDVIDCLTVSKQQQPRKRLYHLKRGSEEIRINDYNPALLMANQANVDVQFIGHMGSRLPYYITDYMSKCEVSEQDNMWRDILTSAKSLGSNAMSFLLKAVKSRQVGAIEAADRLLGHKLHSKSRQMRFADLLPADKAKRVLKHVTELEVLVKNNPDSEDIFLPHWVLDVHPARPDRLENVCLYDLLGWYEKEKRGKDQSMKIKTSECYLRKRTGRPYIVTHQLVNPNHSEEEKEKYYYYLLKLFVPWRDESDFCEEGRSYHELFLDKCNSYPDMLHYHERQVNRTVRDEEVERAVRQRSEEMEHEEADNTAEDAGGALQGCVVDQLQTAMQEVLDTHTTAVGQATDNDLQKQYDSLNTDQRRIVDTVVKKVCQENVITRLIVSGQGGTGKSRVISVLNHLVSRNCESNALPVVIAAPTGLAAHNVAGTTIHRLLSLPVEHGKPADYSRLNQDQLVVLRATLKDIKLIIVDEVSMVSSLTLMYIHLRLSEIMSRHEAFGGVSLIFFADLLQLPPVKGNQPFIPVTFREAKQRMGSIGSMDLWRMFEYDELTINMRQSGDLQYADILSGVRVGSLTSEGRELLKSRMIAKERPATTAEVCQLYCQLSGEGKSPIILMPRTAQCDEVNSAMLQQVGNDICDLSAIDVLDTIVDRKSMPKVEKAYKKTEDDVTRTAGLEKRLQLCVGSRVMLKRNKNVEAGLVNGSVGTVLGFGSRQKGSSTEVSTVKVLFDGTGGEVDIERESCSFEVLKGIYYTRKQFPLMLAFAITIHKSQGLSLETAIVDAGSSCFGCGMIYVALSRVTSLDGLHLIAFDITKIVCDMKAIDEYNRLRQLYRPQLGQLTGVTTAKVRKRKIGQPADGDVEDQCQRKARKRSSKVAEGAERPGDHATVSSRTTDGVGVSDSNQAVQTTSTEQLALDSPVFRHCSVNSIDEVFKAATCQRLNLPHSVDVNQMRTHLMTPAAAKIRDYIQQITHNHITVTIHKVSGAGGNCLFRAFSLALTGRQDHHELLRHYIVNHMLDADIRNHLRQLYHGTDDEYNKHLIDMQNTGTWGTDQEIASAAHLFQCSVLCFAQYNNRGEYSIQAITPHFSTDRHCNNDCKHQSIYLVNTSGAHFDLAIVSSHEADE